MTYVYTISYPAEQIMAREDFAGLFFQLDAEGWEEKEDHLELYASDEQLEAIELQLTEWQAQFGIQYTRRELPQKNWNEQWERSFQPVAVGDWLYIRATFHAPKPGVLYDIQIEPKMSFGTGHHPTTLQMMQLMKLMDFSGKSVLDCGSGTGILAILAEKMGARQVIALDYDEWCFTNGMENIALNHCHAVTPLHGGIERMEGQEFDIILANIHRNYLLENMAALSALLKKRGELLVSGFYSTDAQAILDVALEHGLIASYESQLENWACILLRNK